MVIYIVIDIVIDLAISWMSVILLWQVWLFKKST